MNSPFLCRKVQAIANKSPSIKAIYQTVRQRPPTPKERKAATTKLQNLPIAERITNIATTTKKK